MAAFALAGFGGLTISAPAQAYTMNCIGSGASWPSTGVQSCGPVGGSPDAQRTAVLNAVLAINGTMANAYGKLTAAAPRIFVFNNVGQMTTYFTERGLTVPAVAGTPAGVTAYDANNNPLYSFVFTDYAGVYSPNAGVHELGHWADYLYRGLAYAAPTTSNRTSDMFLFRNLVVQDRASFDRLSYPVAPTPAVPQCGAGSIFTGKKDGLGHYICSGATGTGAGLNTTYYPNGTVNADVLDIGFTEFMDVSTTTRFKEVFSEAFAVVNGALDGGIQGFDQYFAGTRFNCTKKFVQKIGQTGVNPTQADLEGWGCVIPCRAYPTVPGPNYALNGHLFNCLGYPRSAAELQYQNELMNGANAAIADFTTDQKTKFNTKNIDVYVYYNGADALLGKRIDVTGATVTTVQMGKSFVEAPVGNPTLPRPSSIVWAYNKTDWETKYATIPKSPSSSAYSGTVHHELGHQIDRIWAKDLAYAPTTTSLISLNNTNEAYYLKAVAWDWVNMSAADKATLWSSYPYVMTNASTIDNYQLFAAQTGGIGLGGIAGYNFISTKLKCSQWVVTQMKNTNGSFPAAPTAGQCYNNTTW